MPSNLWLRCYFSLLRFFSHFSFFMIWAVEFGKCLPFAREQKGKREKKRKSAIDFYRLLLYQWLFFFTFFLLRSSVYLIVPNIDRHIVYLFFFLSSIDPWNSISSNKDFFSLSSSSVFFFSLSLFFSLHCKSLFKCICARQCRHHHPHHHHCHVSQRWV